MFFRLDDVLQNRTPMPARHRPAIRPSSVSGLFAKTTPLAGTTPDSASPEKNAPSTETQLYDRVTRETTAVIDVRPICQLPGANGRPLDRRSHLVKTLSVVVVLLLSMASRSSGQIRGFGF